MNIDDLTVGEIKHIQSLLKDPNEAVSPYQAGKNYFIRTILRTCSKLPGTDARTK